MIEYSLATTLFLAVDWMPATAAKSHVVHFHPTRFTVTHERLNAGVLFRCLPCKEIGTVVRPKFSLFW